MTIPENYRYTADHEWLSIEGDIATVGITDHAQDELTDIVFVELPEVDNEVEAEAAIAVVESVKAASDIYAPIDGVIVEANEALEGEPALVNTNPHDTGWIFKIKIADQSQVDALMDAAAYATHIGQ